MLSLSLIVALLPLSLAAPAPFAPPPSLAGEFSVSTNIFNVAPVEKVKVKRRMPPMYVKAHGNPEDNYYNQPSYPYISNKNNKRGCVAKSNPTANPQQPIFLATSSSDAFAAESSSAVAAPQSSASAGGVSSETDNYFPVPVKSRWTTVDSYSNHLSFDAALKPLTAGRLPDATSAPDGSLGLHAAYPANTFKYSAATGAGFSFYSPGVSSVDVSAASEVTLSYSVYFSEDFDFVKGGKLPGLYGGASMAEAKSCSGGRQEERDRCFSARLMWRTNGMGELYNYFPLSGNNGPGYCQTAPMSKCDANFGDSIGRGAFTFPSGKWTTVTQRLKLNSPASASNGEQELWVDGKQVLNLTGLQIRMTDETKIYGIMAQTFFGGGDASWASPKDQDAWFKDWSVGIVA